MSEDEYESGEAGERAALFEQVAAGIQQRDRAWLSNEVLRWTAFVWAVISCLCAGSVLTFSLYGHLFQSRLGYSQMQVNLVAIACELGLYLPVPLTGYLCDRYGSRAPALAAAALAAAGYVVAAFAYRAGPAWPFGVMVAAFGCVGASASSLYLAAITTSAKNFGRRRHKGLALSVPIAAFGLSAVVFSQLASRLLAERRPDGRRGPVDVFRYFLFLAAVLSAVAVAAAFLLTVVDEAALIDEAVEDLERSGLLPRRPDYGALDAHRHSDEPPHQHKAQLDRARDRTKTWLLNEETSLFLSDRTMWLLAAGFMLVAGAGDAFVNNLGTIIPTLFPADMPVADIPTSAATHLSILAIVSTVVRLLVGSLTDLLAPSPSATRQLLPQQAPVTATSSPASTRPPALPLTQPHRFTISRVVFLVFCASLFSVGLLVLASGAAQTGDRAARFALVSGLVGAGYGAVFTLVPIIISVVWPVENFGTNWGIVALMPAVGALIWGLVYSVVYQAAADSSSSSSSSSPVHINSWLQAADVTPFRHNLCHGAKCYAPTSWLMAMSIWLACGLWIWAWKGPNGWQKRGVLI